MDRHDVTLIYFVQAARKHDKLRFVSDILFFVSKLF